MNDQSWLGHGMQEIFQVLWFRTQRTVDLSHKVETLLSRPLRPQVRGTLLQPRTRGRYVSAFCNVSKLESNAGFPDASATFLAASKTRSIIAIM